MKWNPSILTQVKNKSVCWWCGGKELTGEHKFKKTDLEIVYRNNILNNGERIGIVKFDNSFKPIPIKGTKNSNLKFHNNLCKKCNGSRSAPFDKAYEKVMKFYVENEQRVTLDNGFDFKNIFGENWLIEREDFINYCVKHVAVRLFDSNIQPSQNMIDYLNGGSLLYDIKFVFLHKTYNFGLESGVFDTMFMGPINRFERDHYFIGKKMTSVSSWYDIKGLSINYIFEKFISKGFSPQLSNSSSSFLSLRAIDYEGFEEKEFEFNIDSPKTSLIKILAYKNSFPFVDENAELKHYEFVQKFKLDD